MHFINDSQVGVMYLVCTLFGYQIMIAIKINKQINK